MELKQVKRLRLIIEKQDVIIGKMLKTMEIYAKNIDALSERCEKLEKNQENVENRIEKLQKEQYNDVVLEIKNIKEQVENLKSSENNHLSFDEMKKELWEDYRNPDN